MNDIDKIIAHEGDDMECVAQISVKIARSGAMAVMGNINDELWAIACLEQAIQSVKDYHKRQNGHVNILVPSYDSALAN